MSNGSSEWNERLQIAAFTVLLALGMMLVVAGSSAWVYVVLAWR